MIIGQIEGYNVIYDEEHNLLHCKNVTIKPNVILEAYESNLDRVTLQEELVLRIFENKVTLGCFNLTLENSRQLINKIKKIKKNGTKVASL